MLTFRKVEVRRPSRGQLQSSHFPDRLPRAQREAATGADHTAKPGTLCKGVSCVGLLVLIPGPANAVWTKPHSWPSQGQESREAARSPGAASEVGSSCCWSTLDAAVATVCVDIRRGFESFFGFFQKVAKRIHFPSNKYGISSMCQDKTSRPLSWSCYR